MLRFGLITYLLFATLAGPGLCCCTMVRVLACAVDSFVKRGPDQGCSCCSKTVSKEDPEQTSKSAPPKRDDCPCKVRSETRPAFTLVDRVEITSSSIGYDLVDFASVYDVAIPCAKSPHVLNFAEPFLLAGQDLLSAFQILRC